MGKVYIALGKTGDQLSVLPILHHEYVQTKQKPKVVVSKDYTAAFQGASYVEPLIFGGQFADLHAAIHMVKSQGHEAVPLQVYGKDFPMQHRTPSFQLDQWERAGFVQHFYDWPLVIDKRNRDRETKLIKSTIGKRPYILLAEFSESSPFPDKESLAASLKDSFGKTHDIIRLSEVRAQSFFDLLGLYNRASILVTIETAHLHLSRASQVPVIALTTEQASRWNGSAWHPRFVFHCRYKDYQNRRGELLRAVQRVLSKETMLDTEQVKTEALFGYNPSIIEGNDLMTYRYHPKRGWRTILAATDGVKTRPIHFPEGMSEFSHEDARLFRFNDRLYISFVLARNNMGLWNSVVGYGQLIQSVNGWSVEHPIFPRIGQNNWGALEKNWLFFEHDKKLMCIYSSTPEQIVMEIEGDTAKNALRSKGPTWPLGEIRGGCMIQHGELLLRFFHSHTTDGPREGWIYYIGAALMENKPPFQTLSVTQLPIISGNEKWTPNCFHWKQNVVFPGGVVREGNGWKLAYGANDSECRIAHITPKDLGL